MFCDIVCFLFVTPLATISGWLCLKGVKDDLQLGSLLQNTGLISLTLVLFTIYSLWTMVTTILVLTTLTFRLLAKDPFLIPPFFFFFLWVEDVCGDAFAFLWICFCPLDKKHTYLLIFWGAGWT